MSRWIIYFFYFLLSLDPGLLVYRQVHLTVKEIVRRNIQMTGDEPRLKHIENYIFKTGLTTHYLSFLGEMKIVVRKEPSITVGERKIAIGKEPIVADVILVNEKQVKRNSFNEITEISGLQKSVYQCLASLRSGLFTLMKFESLLEFQGVKEFGPEKFVILTANCNDLKVDFYLDDENFKIKRVVFKGFDQEKGKYEVSHDFGPFQSIEGFNIPSCWFSSEVGKRGNLYEISDVKFNQSLPENFFYNIY